jgi:hypothetical protein
MSTNGEPMEKRYLQDKRQRGRSQWMKECVTQFASKILGYVCECWSNYSEFDLSIQTEVEGILTYLFQRMMRARFGTSQTEINQRLFRQAETALLFTESLKSIVRKGRLSYTDRQLLFSFLTGKFRTGSPARIETGMESKIPQETRI